MAQVQIGRAADDDGEGSYQAGHGVRQESIVACLINNMPGRPSVDVCPSGPTSTSTPASGPTSTPISTSIPHPSTTSTEQSQSSIPASQSTVSANQSNNFSHQTDKVTSEAASDKSVSADGANNLKTSQPITNSTTISSPPVPVSNPIESHNSTLLPTQSHNSTSSSPTQSHNSTSSPTVPIGVLIGAVLAAVVISMGAALFICYFQVLRRRWMAQLTQQMLTRTGNSVPSLLISRQAIEPYIFANTDTMQENPSSVEYIAATQQCRSITKDGHRNPAVVASPSSTPQWRIDLISTQSRNGNNGRRAVDAGPIVNATEDEDDTESTLPPEYGDVFTSI